MEARIANFEIVATASLPANDLAAVVFAVEAPPDLAGRSTVYMYAVMGTRARYRTAEEAMKAAKREASIRVAAMDLLGSISEQE